VSKKRVDRNRGVTCMLGVGVRKGTNDSSKVIMLKTGGKEK